MSRQRPPAVTRLAAAAAVAAALLTASARPVSAQRYEFRWCDSFLPNCAAVTLTLVPPAPGTPELFPGSGIPWQLRSRTVYDIGQLTVDVPDVGPVYFGPAGFYQLFPRFLNGGPGFFTDGGFDDTPWLFGGPPLTTEGRYTFDDWDYVRPSGGIVGLSGSTYSGGGLVTFTPLTPLATPEPRSFALLAAGLLGVAGVGLRRRRAPTAP